MSAILIQIKETADKNVIILHSCIDSNFDTEAEIEITTEIRDKLDKWFKKLNEDKESENGDLTQAKQVTT